MTLSYPCDEFSPGVVRAVQQFSDVVLGVRPYAVKRRSDGVRARVVVNQWLGDQSHIAADYAGQTIILVEHDRALDKPGDELSLYLDPASLHLFDPATGNAISHGSALV